MRSKTVKFKRSIESVFEEFLAEKAADGLSSATLRCYRGHFEAVAAYLDVETPVELVTDRQIKLAIADMAGTDLSRNSIRSYTATLKTFFSWCRQEGLCDVEIRLFKGEETVPETYTDRELQLLLKHPARGCTFAQMRSWAIVNLLVNNGLRAASVRSIKVKDVLLDQSAIMLRHTKRRRAQMLPLSPAMAAVMREYLHARDGDPEDWLFPASDGGQMSEGGFRTSIVRYNRSRGVDKTGIHAFRHTFARLYLVDCGGDALKLQRLLGHSTLKMTQHYVKLFDDDLIADFQHHSPLERIKAKK